MRRTCVVGVVAAAGALLVVACGAEPAPEDGASAPDREATTTVTVTAAARPAVLRPASGDLDEPAMVAGVVTVPEGFLIIGERILPDGSTVTAFWTSRDGVTWTEADADPAVWGPWTVDRAAQGPAGIVVLAGSQHGRALATSADGNAWTVVPITAESLGLPSDAYAGGFPINDVAAVDNGFLALGQLVVSDGAGTRYEPLLLTSTDGATWRRATGPALGPSDLLPEYFAGATTLDAVSYALVTATQGADAWLWRSTDTVTWDLVGRTELFGSPGTVVSALTSFDGRLVAAGHDQASGRAAAWTSTDGLHWTPAAADDLAGPASYAGWVLAPSGDQLLMIGTAQAGDGARTGTVWASTDGDGWVRGPDGPSVGDTTFVDAASDGSTVTVAGWQVVPGPDLAAVRMDAWWVEEIGAG